MTPGKGILTALIIAAAAAVVLVARSKRPQLPEPAAEPPRIGQASSAGGAAGVSAS